MKYKTQFAKAYHMEDILKALEPSDKNLFQQDMRDNLFKANHRNAMIQKYGYTEAMRVTVGELCQN